MAHKVTPFLVLLSCMFLVAYSIPTLHNLPKRNSQRFCGRMLVQALALVCQSVYYDPSEEDKRSVYKADWDEQVFGLKGKPRTPELLFPKVAASLMSNSDSFERGTRGIIDECCKKSCTFDELASYCY